MTALLSCESFRVTLPSHSAEREQRVKFLVDEDLSEEIASFLRGEGVDAVHVREIGLSGIEDQVILDAAAHQERSVITCDRNDFLMLTEFYFHAGPLTTPL